MLKLRLHVGWESWVRRGTNINCARSLSSSVRLGPIVTGRHGRASSNLSSTIGGVGVFNSDASTCDGSSNQVRADSIRSRSTWWWVPVSRSTPQISIVSVPAPLTWAPMAFKRRCQVHDFRSRAAFSIIVVPSAKVAAIIRFSVPVTVVKSITNRVPLGVWRWR